MSERNETWADIAAELRAEAKRESKYPYGWYEQPSEVVVNRLNGLADRIEAAGNREGILRDKTSFHCGDCAKFGFDCDAGDVDGNEDCLACENFVRGDHFRDAAKMVGNEGKLREALGAVVECAKDGVLTIRQSAFDKVVAALAAPPRNCDVGTVDEQKARMADWCHRTHCGDCPYCTKWCALSWANAPYDAAQEGGDK